jgi:hypothetical protein
MANQSEEATPSKKAYTMVATNGPTGKRGAARRMRNAPSSTIE